MSTIDELESYGFWAGCFAFLLDSIVVGWTSFFIFFLTIVQKTSTFLLFLLSNVKDLSSSLVGLTGDPLAL
jgi:hypothetical protein